MAKWMGAGVTRHMTGYAPMSKTAWKVCVLRYCGINIFLQGRFFIFPSHFKGTM